MTMICPSKNHETSKIKHIQNLTALAKASANQSLKRMKTKMKNSQEYQK
jgi:hypothetical protein